MADGFRRPLYQPIRVADQQRLLDCSVGRDRLGDRQRTLLVLAVELLAGLPDRGRTSQQCREQEDADLESQDLVGER